MLMKALRSRAKGCMWVVLILITIAFTLSFGYQSWLTGPPKLPEAVAMTVNGREILSQVFSGNYQSRMETMRQRERTWRPTLPRERKLTEEVVNSFVDHIRQVQIAQDLGIQVTRSQVQEHISSLFRNAGVPFTQESYLAYVYSMGLTPAEFEAQQRDAIRFQRVRSLLNAAYPITDAEVREEFSRRNTLYELEYISYRTDEFLPGVEVYEEGLQSFFEKQEYTLPERVKVRYVHFDVLNFVDRVQLTERDLERHYSANAEQFEVPAEARAELLLIPKEQFHGMIDPSTQELETYFYSNRAQFNVPAQRRIRYTYIPVEEGIYSPALTRDDAEFYFETRVEQKEVTDEQAKARRILIALAPNASPWKRDEALAKIVRIRAEIEQGLAFAEAAERYSEDDETAQKGGDMGWFSRGIHGSELDRVAFRLDPGRISEPVRDHRGYHLLLLEDRRKNRMRTFEEQEEMIKKTLANERLMALRFQVLNAGLSSEILGATYPIRETALFPADATHIDEIIGKDAQNLTRQVATLREGDISSLIYGERNFYIAEILEATDERMPEYSEITERVREAFIQAKALERAYNSANEIWARIQREGLPFSEASNNLGVSTEIIRTATFERTTEIPELGNDTQGLMNIVFGRRERDTVVGGMRTGQIDVSSTDRGGVVIHVTHLQEPYIPPLAQVRDRIESMLRVERAPSLALNAANDVLRPFMDRQDIRERIEASQRDLEEADGPAYADRVKRYIEGLQKELAEIEAMGATLGSATEVAIHAGLSPNLFTVGITDYIHPNSRMKVRNFDRSVVEAAMAIEKIGDIMPVPIPSYHGARYDEVTDYFLLEIVDRLPQSPPKSLDEMREQVVEDYRNHLAAERARARAESTFRRLKEAIANSEFPADGKEIDMAAFARSLGAPYTQSDEPRPITQPNVLFQRTSQPNSLIRTLRRLEPGRLSGIVPNLERPRGRPDAKPQIQGYYVLQLVSRKSPDWTTFPSEQERIRRFLAGRTSQNAYTAWLESIRKDARLELNESLKRSLAAERGEEL